MTPLLDMRGKLGVSWRQFGFFSWLHLGLGRGVFAVTLGLSPELFNVEKHV